MSCDELVCPSGTFKCKIEKKSIPNTVNMNVHKVCFDKQGE